MRKLFVVLGLLLISTMLFVGCGTTDNSSVTQPQPLSQTNERTGTLQGKIMDAVTGAAIGNDDNSELKVWLIQGTDNRGASKLITDKNDPLCGEYAFDNIPVDLYYGNATFKVVVVKAGYQRFEADVELNDNIAYNEETILSSVDKVINMIGNIYLFKDGYRAGDVDVYVLDNASGMPIPNALVAFYQDVENNIPASGYFVDTDNTSYENGNGLNPYYDMLFPTGGLYTDITTTTDANGKATMSGTKLVLGGRYEIVVAPMTWNGQVFGFSSTSFREYTANAPVYLNLSSATGQLFATSASNEVPSTVTASGVLTVTFNQPIALTTTGFVASGLASDNTPTTADIQAVLSADGLTMTLTPASYITGTTADIASSVVTYTPVGGTDAMPFIIKSTQQNSGYSFDGYVCCTWRTALRNIKTGNDVSKTVRQIGF